MIVVGSWSAMSIVDPMIQQNPKIKIALIDKDQSGGSHPTRKWHVLTNRRMIAREEGIELLPGNPPYRVLVTWRIDWAELPCRQITMPSARNLLSNLKPSGSLKIVALLSAIAIFSVVSYATSVSVSTTTYQSQYGVSYNVTGAFTAADRGFQVVPSGVAASAQPCTWANNGTCETGLTQGHYEYLLLLTLNTVPGSTTTYTVTVKWDQGSGQSQMGQLTVSVQNTATAGNSMTFHFDTAGTSFTTPLSIDVVVA